MRWKIAVLAALAACSPQGWSEETRQTFIETCDEAAKSPVSGYPDNENTRSICYCAVDWMEDHYPDENEVDEATMARAFRECV